jgi:hypothetical protein
MRVAHDHSIALSRTLLSQVMNGVIGTEYNISVAVGNQDITFGDTVILKGGTYQFEQTGELIYEVTFVKVV